MKKYKKIAACFGLFGLHSTMSAMKNYKPVVGATSFFKPKEAMPQQGKQSVIAKSIVQAAQVGSKSMQVGLYDDIVQQALADDPQDFGASTQTHAAASTGSAPAGMTPLYFRLQQPKPLTSSFGWLTSPAKKQPEPLQSALEFVEQPMSSGAPVQKPLLLTYDPNFKNQKAVQPAVDLDLEPQAALASKPFASTALSQVETYNQSAQNYYTTSAKKFSPPVKSTSALNLPIATTDNSWQGQSNSSQLSEFVLDDNLPPLLPPKNSTIAAGQKNVRSSQLLRGSSFDIVSPQIAAEQQKIPRNPALQAIIDTLTSIKNIILKALGYTPTSAGQVQVINAKIEAAARVMNKNKLSDGTINPLITTQQVGLLMQDIANLQQQSALAQDLADSNS